jgi:hypothetical protein
MKDMGNSLRKTIQSKVSFVKDATILFLFGFYYVNSYSA